MIRNITFSLCCLLIFIAILEIASCNGLNHHKVPTYLEKNWNSDQPQLFKKDSLLGYKANPSIVIRQKEFTSDHKLIYDVRYTTDSLSRRRAFHNDPNNDRYVLFFGGSFVFGDGLENDETLPEQFAQTTDCYNSYNYGFSGYGPQHMYSLLKEHPIREQIAESEGICIYVFIDDHIFRTIGDRNTLDWGASFPDFMIAEKVGDRRGIISKRNPWHIQLLQTLNKSYTLSLFQIDLVKLFLRQQALQRTVAYLKACQELYQSRFGSEAFYVILYPESKIRIQEELTAVGIQYIDLSEGHYSKIHPFDFHPDAGTNAHLAKAIKNKLNID